MYKVIDLIKTVDAVCPREEDVESLLKRAEEMASACEELLSGAAELNGPLDGAEKAPAEPDEAVARLKSYLGVVKKVLDILRRVQSAVQVIRSELKLASLTPAYAEESEFVRKLMQFAYTARSLVKNLEFFSMLLNSEAERVPEDITRAWRGSFENMNLELTLGMEELAANLGRTYGDIEEFEERQEELYSTCQSPFSDAGWGSAPSAGWGSAPSAGRSQGYTGSPFAPGSASGGFAPPASRPTPPPASSGGFAPPSAKPTPPPPTASSMAPPASAWQKTPPPSASHAEAPKGKVREGDKKAFDFILDLFNRKSQKKKHPVPTVDSVQFSAVVPERAVPGKYFNLNIMMYEDGHRAVVDELLRGAKDGAREVKGGYTEVERDSQVRVVLSSPELADAVFEETRLWKGKYLDFTFSVKIPADLRESQMLFTATVYINDLIATRLQMTVDMGKAPGELAIGRSDIRSAFVSYAHSDVNRVAGIVQGMKSARPDIDLFFDIDNLRSGQRWEESLKSEIENRDVLFLCWSRAASASEWVNKEWRYALESKGEDGIEPVPIETPDICPPPAELKNKHFNDRMLYIIKATE